MSTVKQVEVEKLLIKSYRGCEEEHDRGWPVDKAHADQREHVDVLRAPVVRFPQVLLVVWRVHPERPAVAGGEPDCQKQPQYAVHNLFGMNSKVYDGWYFFKAHTSFLATKGNQIKAKCIQVRTSN